jgi:hypothetical protein
MELYESDGQFSLHPIIHPWFSIQYSANVVFFLHSFPLFIHPSGNLLKWARIRSTISLSIFRGIPAKMEKIIDHTFPIAKSQTESGIPSFSLSNSFLFLGPLMAQIYGRKSDLLP